MKKIYFPLLSISILIALYFNFNVADYSAPNKTDKLISKLYPSDYAINVRSFPFLQLDLKAYKAALQEVKAIKKSKQTASNNFDNYKTNTTNWIQLGPTNIGGRINTIAVDQVNQNNIYVGCAKGGVFKTTDDGQTWNPIFDEQSYLAIGDIEIDPNDPNSVFVGTGDVNISGSHYIGDGLYHSIDAGNTWMNIGLQETGVIAQVRVQPQNSNTIYVAAMGFPQTKDANRGLYKSIDGGQTFNQILFVNDSTGIIDLILHPTDENIIYAATWVRYRTNSISIVAGTSAKIYKSLDGGNTWNILESGLPYDINNPNFEDNLGRIGLTIDLNNPDILYSQFIGNDNSPHSIYKTTNAGNTWSEINNIPATTGFSWYFGKIRLNPYAPNKLFVLDVQLWKTEDDGNFWDENDPNWSSYIVHADKHDIYFIDADSYILATDGGLYKTTDNGYSWTDFEDIPNSQFYHVKVNPHVLNDYWGGLQDNGTTHGNETNINAWPRVYGGDGFNVEFRKDDPNIIYAETQRGNIYVSDNAGINFYDADYGVDINDRTDWNTPFIVSNHDPNVLYRGTYRIYKSDSGTFPYWQATSGDLTNGDNNDTYPPVISDINESPVDPNIIYAGTTDGRLHISEDDGYTFNLISDSLPNFYLTDVEAGNDTNQVFVTFSGYYFNNYVPHVHVSFDKGETWQDISGNLPQIGVNDIEQHPTMDSLLFVATDGAVFFTENLGENWQMLGENLPIVNVADVEIDTFTNKLIAGTFARSMWSFDIEEYISDEIQTITIETSGDEFICEGDSVILSVSGGNFYSWSNDEFLSCNDCSNPTVNVSESTTFTVTACLTANNCDSTTINITVYESPEIPLIDFDGISLSTTNVAQFYQWYFDGSIIPNATQSNYQPSLEGNYYLATSNNLGCEFVFSDSLNVVLSSFTIQENPSINIFPNPASNFLQIESAANIDHIKIYDLNGKIIWNKNFSFHLNIENLNKGSYILNCFDRKNNMIATKRFEKI